MVAITHNAQGLAVVAAEPAKNNYQPSGHAAKPHVRRRAGIKTKYMPVKKYLDHYYQVIKVDGAYGWKIYDCYGKNKQVLQTHEDVCDDEITAELDARDCIEDYYG